jgi:type IV secretion system protein VirB8
MNMTTQKTKSTPKDYFNRARSWADDNFSQLHQSRNRYQLAFVLSMGLNMAACSAVAVLANYQTLVPMMVHHYENGITTVEPLANANAPINKAQVESDIVRYITNREAYDISSYRAQFDLISLLSNSTVGAEYLQEQDKSNKEAPINLLGANASRQIHLYSINFLDASLFNEKDLSKTHQNVAEVVFTLTDTDKLNGKPTERHYSALISWQYVTPTTSPAERWQNWDGFQVIRYSKTFRNV